MRNRGNQQLACFAAVALLCAALPAGAFAHGLQIWVYAADRQLVIDAEYGEDDPVVDGQVTIVGPKGELVADGKTNAKGRFTLAADGEFAKQHATLQIVVDAGMGHRGTKTLRAAELQDLFSKSGPNTARVEEPDDVPPSGADNSPRDEEDPEPGVDRGTADSGKTTPAQKPLEWEELRVDLQRLAEVNWKELEEREKAIEKRERALAEGEKHLAEVESAVAELTDRVDANARRFAQITGLRRQLMIARIIAGLGIILGLTGLAAFWLSRRDHRRSDLRQPPSV